MLFTHNFAESGAGSRLFGLGSARSQPSRAAALIKVLAWAARLKIPFYRAVHMLRANGADPAPWFPSFR